MAGLNSLRTHPDAPDFRLFTDVVASCYAPDSPRWRGGHEVDRKHLENCLVVLRNDLPVARCAFYINPHYHGSEGTTGLVGSYECIDDLQVANVLFEEVRTLAREHRITRLIGPMDGSTWNGYRFSDADDRPRFLMEPYHHPWYPAQWIANGFAPLARYGSRIDRVLAPDGEAIRAKDAELAAAGLRVRALNKSRLAEELSAIGAFSIEAFAGNFLYAPIGAEKFVAKYERIGQLLVPELVLLAEDHEGSLMGFILGMPDAFDASGTTLIVKSAARKKDAPVRGIGTHLLRKLEQAAVGLGFTTAIHAFMHEANVSAVHSAGVFGAEPYGSYTLFEKRLYR